MLSKLQHVNASPGILNISLKSVYADLEYPDLRFVLMRGRYEKKFCFIQVWSNLFWYKGFIEDSCVVLSLDKE